MSLKMYKIKPTQLALLIKLSAYFMQLLLCLCDIFEEGYGAKKF